MRITDLFLQSSQLPFGLIPQRRSSLENVSQWWIMSFCSLIHLHIAGDGADGSGGENGGYLSGITSAFEQNQWGHRIPTIRSRKQHHLWIPIHWQGTLSRVHVHAHVVWFVVDVMGRNPEVMKQQFCLPPVKPVARVGFDTKIWALSTGSWGSYRSSMLLEEKGERRVFKTKGSGTEQM